VRMGGGRIERGCGGVGKGHRNPHISVSSWPAVVGWQGSVMSVWYVRSVETYTNGCYSDRHQVRVCGLRTRRISIRIPQSIGPLLHELRCFGMQLEII